MGHNLPLIFPLQRNEEKKVTNHVIHVIPEICAEAVPRGDAGHLALADGFLSHHWRKTIGYSGFRGSMAQVTPSDRWLRCTPKKRPRTASACAVFPLFHQSRADSPNSCEHEESGSPGLDRTFDLRRVATLREPTCETYATSRVGSRRRPLRRE